VNWKEFLKSKKWRVIIITIILFPIFFFMVAFGGPILGLLAGLILFIIEIYIVLDWVYEKIKKR